MATKARPASRSAAASPWCRPRPSRASISVTATASISESPASAATSLRTMPTAAGSVSRKRSVGFVLIWTDADPKKFHLVCRFRRTSFDVAIGAPIPALFGRRREMKVMVFVKATEDSEAGRMPGEELMTERMRYNEELVKAGVMRSEEQTSEHQSIKRIAN